MPPSQRNGSLHLTYDTHSVVSNASVRNFSWVLKPDNGLGLTIAAVKFHPREFSSFLLLPTSRSSKLEPTGQNPVYHLFLSIKIHWNTGALTCLDVVCGRVSVTMG